MRLLGHCGSFCSPISIEYSTLSIGLGRMLYSVEILKEREGEMMDGNLYQSPKLSTSLLPLAALMSADHSDPRPNSHCVLLTHIHTQLG